MLITRETDYALRMLRALSAGEQMTAGELSQRELVPQQFAYKILKKLSKQGLVEITRGAEGGCRLTADLHTMSLYDLMRAMEEDDAVIACMDPDYQCPWRARYGACTVHCQLAGVQAALERELRGHSLWSILHGED